MFFEKNQTALNAFSVMSQTAGARADYVQGGGGNTSVKLADGLMAIKASGYCLSDIRPDQAYAVLDYKALQGFYYENQPDQLDDVEKLGSTYARENTRVIEGMDALRPSVERLGSASTDGRNASVCGGRFSLCPKKIRLPHPQCLCQSGLLLQGTGAAGRKGFFRCQIQLGLGALY